MRYEGLGELQSLLQWVLILATNDWQAVGDRKALESNPEGPVAVVDRKTNSLYNFEQIV